MNVGEWATQWAYLHPNEQCITEGEATLSKLEFNQRINRLCHALQHSGLKKGDRVAALMANGHVLLELFFALSKLGGILVPLNFRLSAYELVGILQDSEPDMLVYSPELASLCGNMRKGTPGIKQMICELSGGIDGDMEYEAWIAGHSDAEPVVPYEVGSDDPHLIIYTSGTTGKPKGAVISHGNTLWNAIHYLGTYRCDKSHVTACCAPFFHVGGLLCSAVPNLYVGAQLIIQRIFDPVGILRLIEEHKVNSMLGIPVMYLFMSYAPNFPDADLSSLDFCVAGGSPCSEALIKTYQTKGIRFSQGYGMTEAAVVTTLRAEDCLAKAGSCGKPMFHMSVRVVSDQGEDLPWGESGEILAKGPVVFSEYWRNPDATKATIVDGWIHTGDMGYLDQDGFLYIRDRKKDMYISGGENVYPAEVENVLVALPGVVDAAVIGIPHKIWGETGLAVVIRDAETSISGEQILEACKGKLAPYKIPKKVVFTEELPRTPSGKVLKKALREEYVPGV